MRKWAKPFLRSSSRWLLEHRKIGTMSEGCTDSIPKEFQKLEFCQRQEPRFATAEAATIRRDRGDAGGSKDWDSGKGKNQFWKFVGYQAESRENPIWQSSGQLKDTQCPKWENAVFPMISYN